MGLFGAIKDAVSNAGADIKRTKRKVTKRLRSVAKRVAEAPKAVSAGARQAVRGVRNITDKADKVIDSGVRAASHGASELGRTVKTKAKAASKAVEKRVDDVKDNVEKAVKDVVKDAPKAVKSIADGAKDATEAVVAGARGGVEAVKKLDDSIEKSIGKHFEGAPDWVKKSGKFLWDNKGEIALWVGSAALLAAIPVTGGASGALAGGLMASRIGLLGARVASAGRVGAGAVKAAKGAATLVSAARTAATGTKVGKAVVGGGQAIQKARIALGGTKTGQAIAATAKPLGWAANTLAVANFGDTAVKFSKGDATKTDMALSTLGIVPLVGQGVGKAARLNAAVAERAAAKTVATKLPKLQDEAIAAASKVADVARVAPKVNAPVTAQTARAAADKAEAISSHAAELRAVAANRLVQPVRMTPVPRMAGANGAPVAAGPRSGVIKPEPSTMAKLQQHLDDVQVRASEARNMAHEVVGVAPRRLSPAAQSAQRRLDNVAIQADATRKKVDHLAGIKHNSTLVADGADDVSNVATQIGRYSNLMRNTALLAMDPAETRNGVTTTDWAVANTLINVLLDATAPKGGS